VGVILLGSWVRLALVEGVTALEIAVREHLAPRILEKLGPAWGTALATALGLLPKTSEQPRSFARQIVKLAERVPTALDEPTLRQLLNDKPLLVCVVLWDGGGILMFGMGGGRKHRKG
jgi:hypothetical protein